jgi:predicted nuclease of predicted toxin-antitoxin system
MQSEMGWKKLPVTREDSARVNFVFRRKAKFLIDENLEPNATGLLRPLGWNVVGASEIGLRSRDDRELFAYAWKKDRMLLTKDRDYLDDRRFPEHRNPGLIVLPDASFESRSFIRAMRAVVHIIGPYREAYRKSKIDIASDGQISITSRDVDTGRMEKTRYLLHPDGRTFQWEH